MNNTISQFKKSLPLFKYKKTPFLNLEIQGNGTREEYGNHSYFIGIINTSYIMSLGQIETKRISKLV